MKPTIGLEIHAQLKTHTKMFCDCLNDVEEKHSNLNICPICVGHPGTLPTVNQKAVELVLQTGLALKGQLADKSHFDRKNYFYPDLPKSYQISQYEKPLVKGGGLLGIRLRRIHLEEDTGDLKHEQGYSLVDYNRSGVPLMELVTEPDIKNAEEAAAFAKELQRIFRYLGVSDAEMEAGQMRLEANVSWDMGTKVELKNINSFRALSDAINYDLERQAKILKSGKKIIQETRGWDGNKKQTVSRRTKEEAHDYRYFPEPDLPPLDVGKMRTLDIEKLKAEIPELPEAKRTRFIKQFQLAPEQAIILIQDRRAAQFFEESASELGGHYQLLFNYFTSDLFGLMQKNEAGFSELKITPEKLAHLVGLVVKRKIGSRAAKDILLKMFESGADPHQILEAEKLHQVVDKKLLTEIVKKIIKTNPKAVSDYKNGKTGVIQFLIGQASRELRGRGEPQLLRRLFEENLK